MKHKIIIDDAIPFVKGVFDNICDVVFKKGKDINAEDVRDADALVVRTRTKCDEKLLRESSLKIIASATIGTDHIDKSYCDQRNIKWANAPGCNSGSVYQYVASVLINLEKNKKIDFDKDVLGIVGVGNVGSKIEKLAQVLGIKVFCCDPPREKKENLGYFSFDEILERCSVITFHVPYYKDGSNVTHHMLSDNNKDAFLNKVIINTCRGEVLSDDTLHYLLKYDHLRGAVLDVWENEPRINEELLSLVDLATPHIAGYSVDGKSNGTQTAVRVVSEVLDLGLNGWKVNIPQKEKLIIDAKDKSLTDIILETYDIKEDDKRLKSDLSSFEKFRANYPPRREFHNWTIVNVSDPILKGQLIELGFLIP